MAADADSHAPPLVPASVSGYASDAIIYSKGAAVLAMLEAYMDAYKAGAFQVGDAPLNCKFLKNKKELRGPSRWGMRRSTVNFLKSIRGSGPVRGSSFLGVGCVCVLGGG
jgi:hypothetical protein